MARRKWSEMNSGEKKFALIAMAILFVVLISVGAFSSSNSGESSGPSGSTSESGKSTESKTTTTAPKPVDQAAYKASCTTIPFKALNKNPDSYKGQKYCTTGQVIQIMEPSGETDMRLNVTLGEYDIWSDTIYVAYIGSIPAYEDSIVNIWGEVQGSYSYTAQSGWKITLPLIIAKYVEVVTP